MTISFLGFVLSFGVQSEEAKSLQGTWFCRSIGTLGNPKEEEFGGNSVYRFEGRELNYDYGPLAFRGYFRVLPEKRQIEWYLPLDLWKEVWTYRLQGDELVLSDE